MVSCMNNKIEKNADESINNIQKDDFLEFEVSGIFDCPEVRVEKNYVIENFIDKSRTTGESLDKIYQRGYQNTDPIFMRENDRVLFIEDSTQIYGSSSFDIVAVNGPADIHLDGNIERVELTNPSNHYDIIVKGTIVQFFSACGKEYPLLTFSGLNRSVEIVFADGKSRLELNSIGNASLGGKQLSQ